MLREIKLRKSVRKYKSEKLSEDDMKFVKESVNEAKSLYGNIKHKVIIEEEGEKFYNTAGPISKNLFFIKAPHYLILMSEEKEGFLENAGFIGEQIVLKLAGGGIGTCWIGGNIKDKKFAQNYDTEYNVHYVICIAFGYPEEDLSEVEYRKRKDLEEIFTSENYKEHFEAAKALQSAPSATNKQPWKIYPEKNLWDYYIEEFSGLMSDKRNNLAGIDAGIGLSHILLQSNRQGEMINFNKEQNKDRENLRYITSVKFK
jgi:nitroreductase